MHSTSPISHWFTSPNYLKPPDYTPYLTTSDFCRLPLSSQEVADAIIERVSAMDEVELGAKAKWDGGNLINTKLVLRLRRHSHIPCVAVDDCVSFGVLFLENIENINPSIHSSDLRTDMLQCANLLIPLILSPYTL